jgi:hypothetical protein
LCTSVWLPVWLSLTCCKVYDGALLPGPVRDAEVEARLDQPQPTDAGGDSSLLSSDAAGAGCVSGELCALSFATAVCTRGQCLIASCDEGHVDCNERSEDGCEATLDSTDHCGQCSQHCALANAQPICSDASCSVDSCDKNFGDCDERADNGCERALTTLSDCGACGVSCGLAHATTDCGDGQCAFKKCNAGFGDCNHDAAKLQDGDGCETELSVPENCGACGQHCPSDKPLCSGGKCTSIVCPSDKADCDANNIECETSLHALNHCGSCGAVCENVPHASLSCSTGTCQPTCNSGYANCDKALTNGCETDLHTNGNCGGCGVNCAYANGAASCSTGTCQLGTCNSGYGNCNNNTRDGCEQRLNTSSHCGQCGKACSVANASPNCGSGSCQIGNCNSGFANCDGDVTNGCEINQNSDAKNCGGCNQACPNNFSCQGGRCVCTSDNNCSNGQVCCNGSCIATNNDAANCGGCGHVCGADQTCCSGSCKSLATDIDNCGNCGNGCGNDSDNCSGGSCRCGGGNACRSIERCCSNGCTLFCL